MDYRLGFDGPVSGELLPLLLDVERLLNLPQRGVLTEVTGSVEPSAVAASSTNGPVKIMPCPLTLDPHPPDCIGLLEDTNTYAGFFVGLVVALLLIWGIKSRRSQYRSGSNLPQ